MKINSSRQYKISFIDGTIETLFLEELGKNNFKVDQTTLYIILGACSLSEEESR